MRQIFHACPVWCLSSRAFRYLFQDILNCHVISWTLWSVISECLMVRLRMIISTWHIIYLCKMNIKTVSIHLCFFYSFRVCGIYYITIILTHASLRNMLGSTQGIHKLKYTQCILLDFVIQTFSSFTLCGISNVCKKLHYLFIQFHMDWQLLHGSVVILYVN